MTDYGYARVSTRDQDPQLQINALEQAGCWPIVKEHASGVAKKRPVLDQALAQLKPGDRLTVWKLDRLGRSITFLHRSFAEILGVPQGSVAGWYSRAIAALRAVLP